MYKFFLEILVTFFATYIVADFVSFNILLLILFTGVTLAFLNLEDMEEKENEF